jgi:hypothetical protein
MSLISGCVVEACDDWAQKNSIVTLMRLEVWLTMLSLLVCPVAVDHGDFDSVELQMKYLAWQQNMLYRRLHSDVVVAGGEKVSGVGTTGFTFDSCKRTVTAHSHFLMSRAPPSLMQGSTYYDTTASNDVKGAHHHIVCNLCHILHFVMEVVVKYWHNKSYQY